MSYFVNLSSFPPIFERRLVSNDLMYQNAHCRDFLAVIALKITFLSTVQDRQDACCYSSSLVSFLKVPKLNLF